MPSETVLGVVLAGGASRRMGFDKRALRLDGRSLVERAADLLGAVCDEVAISLQPGATWKTGALRVLHDRRAGCGPLAGLEAALVAAAEESAGAEPRAVFLLACDLPRVGIDAVRHILSAAERAPEAAAVVPIVEHRRQPLCALFRVRALPVVRRQLDGADRSMAALLAAVPVAEVEMGSALPFFRTDLFHNLNRPADLDGLVQASSGSAGRAGG